MKNKMKSAIIAIIFICLMVLISKWMVEPKISAYDIAGTSENEMIYIIGEYLFTEKTPYISTQTMMYAARTIAIPDGVEGTDALEYMKVYLRDLEGNWIEAISGEPVTLGDFKVDIKYKDFERYYNTTAYVSTVEEMETALADEHINVINIIADFTTNHTIKINKEVIINGSDHKITFTGAKGEWSDVGNNYVLEINNTATSMNGLKLTGANAAILVNSSTVTLTGTIDVSGNTFGGIAVEKSQTSETNPHLSVTGATMVNTTEELFKPTIWEDNCGNCVETSLNKMSGLKDKQLHYYFESSLKKEWTQIGTILTKGTIAATIGETIDYKVDGYDGTWKILGLEDKQLLLMSGEDVINQLTLNGYGDDSLTLGVQKLHDECAKFGTGVGATKARSVTIEDVDKVTGYDPIEAGYGKGTAYEYGNEEIYTVNGEKVTKKANYYSYYGDESPLIQKGMLAYDLIFRNDGSASYWLASTFVRTFDQYFNEGIRVIAEDEVQRSYLRIFGNGWAESEESYGVRAVVYLNENIQLERDEINALKIVK